VWEGCVGIPCGKPVLGGRVERLCRKDVYKAGVRNPCRKVVWNCCVGRLCREDMFVCFCIQHCLADGWVGVISTINKNEIPKGLSPWNGQWQNNLPPGFKPDSRMHQ
jgi:hypothetical protein